MFEFIRRLDKNARKLLFTCFYALTCSGILSLMMGSILPDLKAAYGMSDTLSGLCISFNSAGNVIAGFAASIVPLYLGRRRSIMLLSLLSVLGIVLLSVWGNPLVLLLAFLCVGTGRGCLTQFTNRLVNELSGGSPAAQNLLHASFAVGAISSPMLFLLFSRLMGWRAGAVIVIVFFAALLLFFSRMQVPNDRPARGDSRERTLVFLKNPSFLILALMMFCYLCSEYAITGWLVTYLQNKESLVQTMGAEAIVAYSQSMATVMWIVMLIGRLGCAALTVRFSPKRIMLIASLGVTAGFAGMLLSGDIVAATVSIIVLGLCMSGIGPTIYADASVFTNAYPIATSAILVIGSTGAVIMPTIVGTMAERFGFTGGMSAIMVSVVLLVVFAVLNVVVKLRAPKVGKAA